MEQRGAAGSGRLRDRRFVQNGRGGDRQSAGGRSGGAAAGDLQEGERGQGSEEQRRGSARRAPVRPVQSWR